MKSDLTEVMNNFFKLKLILINQYIDALLRAAIHKSNQKEKQAIIRRAYASAVGHLVRVCDYLTFYKSLQTNLNNMHFRLLLPVLSKRCVRKR